jgi:uncharacterized protein (TIGR03437 family)
MQIIRALFTGILFATTGAAQQYIISTVAGGGPVPSPIAATAASLAPQAVAVDSSGNLYVSDNSSVFKVDQNRVLTRIAGNGIPGYSGDGGLATAAQLYLPAGLAFDAAGNLYISDLGNNRVRKVSGSGIIATVAGMGVRGFSGDGGPAVNAQLAGPAGLAVDAAGNLLIADTPNFRIRKVSPGGIITTIAGTGSEIAGGDGLLAINAQLWPDGIALNAAGDLFVGDGNNLRVRKISAATGIISTVAGNGTQGYSGDSGPAVSAQINFVEFVAVDSSGSLLLDDGVNRRIRKITPDGIITTVAGTGTPGFSGDGGQAIAAQISSGFGGLAADTAGNYYIADANNYRVRKVSTAGIINTVAGNGVGSFSGDGGPAVNAQLNSPGAVTIDGSGNLFIADSQNYRIRKVSPNGTITTVAGNGGTFFPGNSGPATSTGLNAPGGIAVDASGNLYIADTAENHILKVAGGVLTTFAGTGALGYSNDGGIATAAALANPTGIAVDGSGNVLVTDAYNALVRKIAPNGIITTVAGVQGGGYSGDGGPALSAQLSKPGGLAVDTSGNVLVSDRNNNRIRKVSSGGTITTVAGNGTAGFSGDGGSAQNAELKLQSSYEAGPAVDGAGNLFIADTINNRVREVTSSGNINTIAGNGAVGYSGDGGPATFAQLSTPGSVATDSSGNVYIADSGNNAIRKLTPTNQTIGITAVVDAASESAVPISPGKIIVIYGYGLGPATGVLATPSNGFFGTQLAGTTVTINGVAAPVYYASATQVNAIVPYATSGTTASVVVSYQSGTSSAFSAQIAAASPGFFSYNATGAGQAAAINVVDGSLNTAANPVKIGQYISFYLTGEGQTTPAGVDGKLATLPLPTPNLPVSATVGGLPAIVQYKGAVYGAVAGLMQVNVQIPAGVTPGGYVPVVLTVGNASTVNGAMWIGVSN